MNDQELFRYPYPSRPEIDPETIEAGIKQLSERQLAILAWVAHGKTNSEIAILFDLGERTVKREVSQMLDALQAPCRHRAAAAYLDWKKNSAPPSA